MPRIDYTELTAVSTEVNKLKLDIVAKFTEFNQANQEFQGSSGKLAGDSWNSARTFFEPYSDISDSIFNALYDVDQALTNYLSAFKASVGEAENRLDTDKLEGLKQQLREQQTRRNALLEALASALKDVPVIGRYFNDNTMHETMTKIDILEKYRDFESAHAGDFSGLDTTLASVEKGLAYLSDSGHFSNGTKGYKSLDYKDEEWYKELQEYNAEAPEERYDVVEKEGMESVSYYVYKNGVLDWDETNKFNWLVGQQNWELIKEMGPEVFKMLVGWDDVEVLLDGDSTGFEKTRSSIFLILSVTPADKVKDVIKTAKLIKNGEKGVDAIKLSKASWKALKKAEASSDVIKTIDKTDDLLDAGKLGEKANDFKFVDNAKNHLKNVEKVNTKNGVVGGHNLDEFNNALKGQGVNPEDLIISKKPHLTIDGVYEIEYKIPRKDITGNIAKPVSYKTIETPKTVYDSTKISDDKMFEWGQSAMKRGQVQADGRTVIGTSSNGLKFTGYLNDAGEITNFFPVIK